MKKFLLLVSFLFACIWSQGQSASPFRQFFFNPYLFNPAYNGINGSTELYVTYRKQWINFNDAPTTMGVNLQYPTKKRVTLGLNIISDEVVALRNTSVVTTFGYVLPIAEDQSLRFGLSGGVGMNDLHLEEGEYDPNDPVIANASQNNFYVDGNFGVLYTYKGLRAGFALTQLFEGNRFSTNEFSDVSFSTLDNRLYSLSYKFPIGSNEIFLEPYVLYRSRADKQNSWEAASIIHIKNKVWAGASYHETNGLGFFLGLNIMDMFRFSYDYELPPVDNDFTFNTSSHELQLAVRLGKKREPLATKKSAKAQAAQVQAQAEENPEEQVIDETVEQNPVQEDVLLPKETTVIAKTPSENALEKEEPFEAEDKNIVEPTPAKAAGHPPRSFSLASGHYVIAGAFKVMENAINYSQNLVSKGYGEATVAINPKNNLYYVYIFSSYDIEEARKARNQYRLRRPFSEAWLFTME